MAYIVSICLFISLCSIVLAGYAAYKLYSMANSQSAINDWAEDVLVNHKKAIEQHREFLGNHRDRIVELFDLLRVSPGSVIQKFGEEYSPTEQ